MLFSRSLIRGPLLVALLASACAPPADAPLPVRQVETSAAALQAYCSVTVVGVGDVDVEGDYLPRVIACENGAADDEALRAQAVAARSYLYYRLATGDGTIADGQSDQVYTCNHAPTQRHYDAVATTAGEVLLYEGTLVAAFYVAGAVPTEDDCVAVPGDNDYSSTEPYVTYNWGMAGAGLEQTTLGWVNESNSANRGCQSQNGADCLSERGWGYEDILRFYYGMDIDHVVADGPCVAPTGLPHGCGLVVSGGETIYDESGACFLSGCAAGSAFEERAEGVSGGSLVTGGYASEERDCFGRWQLSFAEAGDYAVEVHVPDVGARVSEATYNVRHGALDTAVSVDLSAVEGWVSLGSFSFDAGSFQFVELSDTAPENGTLAEGPFVVFDAVRVRPARARVSDAGVADDGGDDADGGVPDDDAGTREGNLSAGVIYECACVASGREGRPGAAGAVVALLGLALFRRRLTASSVRGASRRREAPRAETRC